MQPVLQAKAINKRYGKVVALDNADLELYKDEVLGVIGCLLYTSPSPRDQRGSRMPSSA